MTSINIRTLAIILLSSLSIVKTEIVDRRPLKYGHIRHAPDTSIHKVTLTQKGYIQFLQYIVDVPVITDFTYCIWIRSVNLTHSHPLLSYSRHDTERLIRGWITPGGRSLNLEILENEIYSVPVDLVENQWYHICQSWQSTTGAWIAFINGQIKSLGINRKMRTIKIPNGGEIVVGQEYTDFDKGLDDGIEGDIYGFNLVLATASTVTSPSTTPDKQAPFYLHQNDLAQRRQLLLPLAFTSVRPMNIYSGSQQFDVHGYDTTPSRTSYQISTQTEVPEVLSYFDTGANRNPKGLFEFGKSVWNMFNLFQTERPVQLKTLPELTNSKHNEKLNYGVYYAPRHVHYNPNAYNPYTQQLHSTKRLFSTNSRILHEIGLNGKPLGLVLVELSYNNCALGKGSPINDKRLLISWTKTPVRVFGGAILKSVAPFCLKETY